MGHDYCALVAFITGVLNYSIWFTLDQLVTIFSNFCFYNSFLFPSDFFFQVDDCYIMYITPDMFNLVHSPFEFLCIYILFLCFELLIVVYTHVLSLIIMKYMFKRSKRVVREFFYRISISVIRFSLFFLLDFSFSSCYMYIRFNYKWTFNVRSCSLSFQISISIIRFFFSSDFSFSTWWLLHIYQV